MAFTIGRKGTYIEQVISEHFNISLLARGDGSEIMIQTIARDNLFYIYPSDNASVLEFFYILQGEMICELDGEKIKLGQNDYYTATNLEHPIHFTALTDVVYLWVITEPTFYQLSESITKLINIVDEVEKKDRYTYKHSERVSEYAVKIAKKLMLTKEKLENLYIASLLHDIGKIHTPGEILNKPGKLTDEEFSIIKRHPLDGAEMVKNLYYEDIATIIEQHHERLNGSGYPQKLKGQEILFEARIIAVSDTFDAMTEDRAYRKAYDTQYAIDELKRLVNTHYDKEVVDAFEEILKEEGRI
ncbi:MULTISPECIES: HD domain-containing phosphohydrolase [unclassified Bacillus (in: firmicutes)]|uniref:HD domain-containing phosphohydrolase n=1 Tax=unclassified Bacillus (in: firmicutes) TaxID=185979 RepID=UPI0008EDCEC0|nr:MULTISPECIES: HD domain-containing phosphohydrolase [unclassified Bacillus (in: firmicutes)]SFB02462.1 HDIG domain-containing protein [Bacillus sp. UNCCL13]SFQ89082.1 HDIG domain-containing protein [Bacillus sp. cl95]